MAYRPDEYGFTDADRRDFEREKRLLTPTDNRDIERERQIEARRVMMARKRMPPRVGMGDVRASPNDAVQEPAFGQMGAVRSSPNDQVGGEYPAQTGDTRMYANAPDSTDAQPSRADLVRLRQMKLEALRAAEGGARDSIMANRGNRNFTQPALDARDAAQRELRNIDEAMAGMDRKGSLYEPPGTRLAKQTELANQIKMQGGRDPRAEANDFFTTQKPDLLGMGTGELNPEQTDRIARRESLLQQDGPGSIRHAVRSMRVQDNADTEAAATEAQLESIGNQTVLEGAKGVLNQAKMGGDSELHDADRASRLAKARYDATKSEQDTKELTAGVDPESVNRRREKVVANNALRQAQSSAAFSDAGIGDPNAFVAQSESLASGLANNSGIVDENTDVHAQNFEVGTMVPLRQLAVTAPAEAKVIAANILAKLHIPSGGMSEGFTNTLVPGLGFGLSAMRMRSQAKANAYKQELMAIAQGGSTQ